MKAKTVAFAALIALLASLGIVLPLLGHRPQAPLPPPQELRTAVAPAAIPPTAAPPEVHEAPATEEAAPEALPVPTPGPAIVGVVVDADTGEPVAGAAVRLRDGSLKAVAGDDGSYRLEGDERLLEKESYVIAAAPGYAEEHARARLDGGSDFLQDFQLEPAVELLVTVVTADGEPLEGVQVTPALPNGGYDHGEAYSRRTDREGKTVLPGIGRRRQQQVNARKEDYREVWTRDYTIEPDRAQAELRIVMEKRLEGDAVVTGRVTDAGGAPLTGIHVQWIHSHGESKGRVMTESGADGGYRLVFPRDQDWCAVSAFGDGFAPSIREGVRPGNQEEPAQVDFTLLPGHWLRGQVVDQEKRPVEGALVRAMPTIYLLRNTPQFPGNVREARTDKRGRFSMWDVSGPAVAIRVKGPPGNDWANNYHREVEVDREMTLELLAWGVIRGRVVDRETGKPVPVFKVKLKRGAGYYDYHRADPGEVFNSVEGLFALEKLDQGSIEFLVEAEGYIPKWVVDVVAAREDQAGVHEVRITRGRTLEGVVVDGASGEPLAGARVVFGAWEKGDLAWDDGSLRGMVDFQELVTDAGGTFRVREGEPGTLFVQRSGYARLALTPAEWGRELADTGDLTVALEPASGLSGVLYEDGKPSKRGFLVLYRRSSEAGTRPREWIGNLDRDDDGRFRAADLAPGDYCLEHWRETPGKRTAGLSVQRLIRLERAREEVVEFGADLGALSFQGRLLGPEGKPLDRARLTLRPDFPWAYTEMAATVTLEREGRFHFLGLRPGTYRLEAADRTGHIEALAAIEIDADLERDFVSGVGRAQK